MAGRSRVGQGAPGSAGAHEANWRNRTIWTRDNLHVLRGMNSACVDLIYLDPPFNSNRTYSAPIGSQAAGAAFKDAWTFDDADRVYLALLQERDPRDLRDNRRGPAGARQRHGRLSRHDGPAPRRDAPRPEACRQHLSAL